MAQTTVTVRMDEGLKKDFDNICNELGMSMSTAITMLAKKMTREKRLPFDASVDPFYSEENLNRIRRGNWKTRTPQRRFKRALEPPYR